MIQRYAENQTGRDFVISDIHGCFDQLEAALDQQGFDPAQDRCFAVGDLIDRGPHSPAALEWLGKPWFHSCLGNHEAMLLAAQDDETIMLNWTLLNGGAWWNETDAALREQFLHAAAGLPLAMEIQAGPGRVGIVHADVPAHLAWPAFLAALEAGDAEAHNTALWSRDRADGWVHTPVAGIDRVVCGHTINTNRKIRIVGNVWLIDTGAYAQASNGHLTVLPLPVLFSDLISHSPRDDRRARR
jgi:serine/threonine protein phosphatase 1